jgi:ribonucleoside-diphosphate reductase alpha chain
MLDPHADLDAVPDPVAVLIALNEHAERLSRSGVCERYIGNMANVGSSHPRAREFVRAKVDGRDLTHFNISVAASDDFLRQVRTDRAGGGRDSAARAAADLWDEIVNAAWSCGDPGLLFLDRFNRDNPTPSLGEFQTTAPCAEVGLAPGESCVFGYLNLGRLTTEGRIDFQRMAALTRCLVRVLDDALEVSLDRYPDNSSRTIMRAKRKIGVAVCGLGDLLATLGVPYGSAAAVETTRDVLGWINYASKLASRELARDRGSFPALPLSRYVQEPSFLCERFGDCGARMVTAGDWERLGADIRNDGLLRNATTTALPPSGRSALLLNASNSIEPWFSVVRPDGSIQPALASYLTEHLPEPRRGRALRLLRACGTCETSDIISAEAKEVFRCSMDIEPIHHLRIAGAATSCVDEGASKTVTLPTAAGPVDVDDVFRKAWEVGVKAVSVYRADSVDGSPDHPMNQGECVQP